MKWIMQKSVKGLGENEKNDIGNKYSTKELATMALFTAFLCVSAYISIALPNGTHITFLNFMITLIALVFPVSQSFMIVLVWLLLGCVGVPVFIAGNAGLGYLFTAWGGYSIAFVFVSIFLPPLTGKKYHRVRAAFFAVLSVIFVDLFGMFQLMYVQGLSIAQAVIPGFFSFIFLDVVKAVTAAWVAPAFRNVIADFRK